MKQLDLFTENFKICDVGLEIIGEPDYEDCIEYGQNINSLESRVKNFVIGDLANLVSDKWALNRRDTMKTMFPDIAISTIDHYQYVARSIEVCRRRQTLSFTHHMVIAPLDRNEQDKWLEEASKNKFTVAELEKAIEAAKLAKIEEAMKPVTKQVQAGDWWILGKHLLYCGDTSTEDFISKLPQASMAFADPPYGADVAEWDKEFYWKHDYLIEKAPIVLVTPGIVSIFEFAKLTKMPYRWALSFWISNGMTRGALGFGNWIFTALFSTKESIHKNAQDFYKVSISGEYGDHKGQKPIGMIVQLIELFTKKNDIVIDPFLGSGTTLITCEQLDRVCIGGEINPEYCSQIIAKWEKTTGKEAKHGNGI